MMETMNNEDSEWLKGEWRKGWMMMIRMNEE
jgi:hypothetical protein